MTILRALLNWCCRVARWRPVMMPKQLRNWALVLETSHKVLTGGRLADPEAQAQREHNATRQRNEAIKAICGYLLRDEELPRIL